MYLVKKSILKGIHCNLGSCFKMAQVRGRQLGLAPGYFYQHHINDLTVDKTSIGQSKFQMRQPGVTITTERERLGRNQYPLD